MDPEKYLAEALKANSPSVCSYWYGKFLQGASGSVPMEANMTGVDPGNNIHDRLLLVGEVPEEHRLGANGALAQHQTFLSPSVHSLMTAVHTSPLTRAIEDHHIVSIDDGSFLLQWDTISDMLAQADSEWCTDYTSIAKRMATIAASLFMSLSKVESSQLLKAWQTHFNWTHDPELFVEALNTLTTSSPLNVSLSLLISTAALERSLGDLCLKISRAQKCPKLLKDLLSTVELEQALGHIQIGVLRAVIGPPSGLNLRNILWHGFTAAAEVPQEYAYLLLAIVASIGHTLHHSLSVPLLSITHRSYAVFTQNPLLSGAYPVIDACDISTIQAMFNDSFFILPSMLPTWEAALHCYELGRYGHYLCLALPSLEHSLRRVFACCNDCPQRILTAESTVLYTTLDEILSPVLEDGVTKNALTAEIGSQHMEMLLDLLVHPEGPRLRDRISHGEVQLSAVTPLLASCVLCASLSLCAQYTISQELTKKPIIKKCLSVSSSYTSLFHPLSFLFREVTDMMANTEQWQELKTLCTSYELGLEEPPHCLPTELHSLLQRMLKALSHLSSSVSTSSTQFMASIVCGFDYSPFKVMLEELWSKGVHTLFVARGVLEITGILRRAVHNMTLAITQVKDTALHRHELQQKQKLHSRQRTNYQRLLQNLPLYNSAVVLVSLTVMVVVVQQPLSNMADHHSLVRRMKRVLQVAENFSSLTSATKNRWEEAKEQCHSLLNTLATLLTCLGISD